MNQTATPAPTAIDFNRGEFLSVTEISRRMIGGAGITKAHLSKLGFEPDLSPGGATAYYRASRYADIARAHAKHVASTAGAA